MKFKRSVTFAILLVFFGYLYFAITHSIPYTNFVLERKIRNSDFAYINNYLDHGGNPNFVFRETNKSAKSLLSIATTRSNSKMVELLLARGADPNYYFAEDFSPFFDVINISHKKEVDYKIMELYASHYTITSSGLHGDKPMHLAYQFGDQRTIEMLLKHPEAKMALGLKNRDGKTPMEMSGFRESVRVKP